MVSIFATNTAPTFWSKYSQPSSCKYSEILVSGVLTTIKDSRRKTRHFQIQGRNFLCLNSDSTAYKYVNLDWLTLEPFEESFSNCTLYGFRLGKHDFYAETSDSLEKWLKVLMTMTILNSFEEDYVIIKTIGKGSTATVYLAEHAESRKSYAVKAISKEIIESQESGVKNLKNEIRILREIEHENIVKLYFVHENSNFVYLVMEYLPAGNLYKRLKTEKKLDEGTCARFIMKLLETLDYLHSMDIVHRDLKLENIIMVGDSNHHFKIIDFGLAYLSSATQSLKCGSPGYVAPEILYSIRYDSKIDIFSTGVILYILLTGKHPFEGKTTEKILKKNFECRFSIDKKLSPNASDVIKHMMEPDPEVRLTASSLLEHPWFNFVKKSSFNVNQSAISDIGTYVIV